MRTMRSAAALDPRLFGRRPPTAPRSAAPATASNPLDDLKLFALTFLGGFLFVGIYLS